MITLHQPTPEGLMSPQEAIQIQPLEDELARLILHRYGGVHAGILDALGEVRYVFCAPNIEGVERALAGVLARFPEYRYKAAVQADPGSEYYHKLLYADADGLQQLREYRAAQGEIARHAQLTSEVIANLASLGDQSSVPRKVDHTIAFSSAKVRDRFLLAANMLGYRVDGTADDEQVASEFKYVVRFSKTQSVEYESIHSAERLLIQIAVRFGGRYEGWRTFPVRP